LWIKPWLKLGDSDAGSSDHCMHTAVVGVV